MTEKERTYLSPAGVRELRAQLDDAHAQIERYEAVIMRLQEGTGLIKVAAERDALREALFREQEEHSVTGGVVRKLAARVNELEVAGRGLNISLNAARQRLAELEGEPDRHEQLRAKYGDYR